jgi:DNA repair protein RecN (Recombination protein N)
MAVKLVDIHSQHKTISLQDADFQLEVLDGFAGLDDDILDYQMDFNVWNALKRDLKKLQKEEEKARSEQDYYQFQYDELTAAKLTIGEQEEIEEELSVLNHVGEIKTRLNSSLALLSDENGLMEKLADLRNELNAIQSFKSEFLDYYKRIQSNYLDMQDVTREIERFEEHVEMDPERTDVLNDRLNLLYQLQQKHRCDTVEELIKVKTDYETKLSDFSSIEDNIQNLKKQLLEIEKRLIQKANSISEKRRKAKVELEKELLALVKDLGLSKARFVVEIIKTDELSEKGIDQVGFLFNANPGSEPMEISKVASGGELSRLMLAIKSIVAAKKLLSTIIFDEIDSGVSGEIAGKMGAIMRDMSKSIQIIAITHVPQIAARGDQHYLVYKEQSANSTNTFLKQLSEDDRIVEIAKMLSDAKVSLSAVETARELLKN